MVGHEWYLQEYYDDRKHEGSGIYNRLQCNNEGLQEYSESSQAVLYYTLIDYIFLLEQVGSYCLVGVSQVKSISLNSSRLCAFKGVFFKGGFFLGPIFPIHDLRSHVVLGKRVHDLGFFKGLCEIAFTSAKPHGASDEWILSSWWSCSHVLSWEYSD